MLALLRFVFRLCEFASCSLPSCLTCYTDSKSLIDTIYKRLEWTTEFRYSTMDSDWDLQQAITSTIRKFTSPPIFLHVKGHQDSTGQISLPLPALLNIEADTLAGSFQYPPSCSPTTAPLVEGSTAQLHSPQGTIHSNYRQVLRRLCSTPALQRYLLNKYE